MIKIIEKKIKTLTNEMLMSYNENINNMSEVFSIVGKQKVLYDVLNDFDNECSVFDCNEEDLNKFICSLSSEGLFKLIIETLEELKLKRHVYSKIYQIYLNETSNV